VASIKLLKFLNNFIVDNLTKILGVGGQKLIIIFAQSSQSDSAVCDALLFHPKNAQMLSRDMLDNPYPDSIDLQRSLVSIYGYIAGIDM